jgi:hypothetical protein
VTQQSPFALFSATRQWNPGDEFILSGARRIVDTAVGPVQPLLYDRNPDVRPSDGTTVAYRNVKRPIGEESGGIYERLSAHLRLGFFSNSVKFDSDLSYASLAVLAGSPEWATPRCWSFYDHVFRNRLPLLGLGLGSMPENIPPFMHTALEKAAVVTTRSKTLASSELARRYGIDYLPCPALLSAPASHRVTQVRRVGVVIGVPYADAVWANGVEPEFYERVCRALDDLFARFGSEVTFDFVLHYIDEMPVVRERFPDHAIRYSFDSSDYFDIFSDYDLVISTRVHGCGAAASLGIPSISLGHDFRSDTTDGFLSVSVDLAADDQALNTAFESLAARVGDVSAELAVHRAATLEEYVQRVRGAFEDGVGSVDYGPTGAITFLDQDAPPALDAPQIASIIEDLVPVSKELEAARASNDELRSVLTDVEASKAEIAAELDGARAAVVRLEGELARRADEFAQELAARPTGVVSALRQWGRNRSGD